jgi:hypothetical protein
MRAMSAYPQAGRTVVGQLHWVEDLQFFMVTKIFSKCST